jgi:TRAP-type C4-dicarboxylate transport system substrate-binding protein
MSASAARRVAWLIATVTVVAATSACQAPGGTDKTGNQTVVLKLASIDGVNGNGQSFGPQAFIDGLTRISGGRLKVEVSTSFGDAAADSESRLVRAIATGQVDGGWPSTRAFSRAGISGLEAVEAPMTITNFNAEKTLVTDPIAAQLLARLSTGGIHGLGLTVGPLRRPFAVHSALLEPHDWQGIAFRAFNSPVQSEAIQALGATPENLGFNWADHVKDGSLDGLEFDIPQYAANRLTTEAGLVTANVVLWPKIFVLSMNRRRFDSMTKEQQGWITLAAQQAVTASIQASYDETTPARALCSAGARFVWASPEQVAATRAALQPVLDRLAADSVNGPTLTKIRAIATRFPQPVTPDVPADCKQAPSQAGAVGTVPSQASTLPDGVYRVQIAVPEVEAAGLNNGDGASGTWTMTVRHATYEVRCRPISDPGHDCGNSVTDLPVEVGALKGAGHTVYFVPDAQRISRLTGCKLPVSETLPGHCGPDTPYPANWAVSGGELAFAGYDTGAGLGIKPWKKIG